MNYDKGPKYIYAQEHNSVLLLLSLCISIIITLEGIEKIIKTKIKRKKRKKITSKQSEENLFRQRCKKQQQTLKCLLYLDSLLYTVRLFDSHPSLVYLTG